MSINNQFLQFYENIKVTPSQRDDAITKYSGVCKKLHDYYYPDIEYNGDTKLLIGSYGKRTHIRPARDIDVIFILPPEKFDQYNDNKSNGQSQLLQDVKKILEEKYPDTPIKAYGKVVVLEFSDTTHNVEVLPAWENKDNTFIIPNSEEGGSWENWDPRLEMQKINESNSLTGKTRLLIRMIKKWSENCTAKLKSYQIENGVLDYFVNDQSWDNEFPIVIQNFFRYFYQTIADQSLRSHLQTALSRAEKACENEDKNDLKTATKEWQKIFGDDFPSIIEKNDNILIENKPLLANYSHCEPLKWTFTNKNKVSISANIYNGEKIIKLGSINSDGRNILPGLSIEYNAYTNAKGEFQFYWQVVNTGIEAESDNGLRGNIFAGNQIRWEDTKYKGKHWIECFIIQDNICLARSGKFFVNIK